MVLRFHSDSREISFRLDDCPTRNWFGGYSPSELGGIQNRLQQRMAFDLDQQIALDFLVVQRLFERVHARLPAHHERGHHEREDHDVPYRHHGQLACLEFFFALVHLVRLCGFTCNNTGFPPGTVAQFTL